MKSITLIVSLLVSLVVMAQDSAVTKKSGSGEGTSKTWRPSVLIKTFPGP